MKMEKKRLAEELVKPLPIAEDAADGARLRFLSPSRLSPWLSAQWLARLCLPARLAARVNTCLEETSSPLDREATGENEQHKHTRPRTCSLVTGRALIVSRRLSSLVCLLLASDLTRRPTERAIGCF